MKPNIVLSRFYNLIWLLCLYSYSFFSHASDNCLDMHVIHSKPLGFYDSNNKPVGLEVEMLREVEKYSGVCMSIHLMPIARILKSLELGLHDGGFMLKSSTPNDDVEYVAYVQNIDTVVVPKIGVKLSQYNDLYDLVIGKTRGTTLSHDFDHDKRLTLVKLTNYPQALEMLSRGRIDAVAGGANPIFYLVKNTNGLQEKVDLQQKFVIGSKEQWLQISKKSKNLSLIPELKKGVEMMIENGAHDRLLLKYWGSVP